MNLAKCSFVFFFTIYTSICVTGQAYFDYSRDVSDAYKLILKLKTDQAQTKINSLKKTQPNNLSILHIENYIDFFTVLIKEEFSDFEKFKTLKEHRLNSIKISGDKTSPYYRFSQAEILLQFALVRAKMGQQIRAGWDINKAHKLLKENDKLFPEFDLNKKSLSLIHSLVGSLKGFEKSMVRLFTSLEGSIEEGFSEIETLYTKSRKEPNLFDAEILTIRALLELHIHKNVDSSYLIIQNSSLDKFESPLIEFIRASIGLQSTNKQEAVDALTKASKYSTEIPFYYLNLLQGISLLQKGDESAKEPILKFINNFNGQHYIKEAHQKMAWYELIVNNNQKGYKDWMLKCLEKGNTEIGEDQLAQKEAQDGLIPNPALLSVRLLCDGGYYEKADSLLTTIQIDQLRIWELHELTYRKARVSQGLNKELLALDLFQKIIQDSRYHYLYYGCNAALQSGIIYVNLNDNPKAIEMFELCLKINPDQHKSSLHQKARSWINRINKKKA